MTFRLLKHGIDNMSIHWNMKLETWTCHFCYFANVVKHYQCNLGLKKTTTTTKRQMFYHRTLIVRLYIVLLLRTNTIQAIIMSPKMFWKWTSRRRIQVIWNMCCYELEFRGRRGWVDVLIALTQNHTAMREILRCTTYISLGCKCTLKSSCSDRHWR